MHRPGYKIVACILLILSVFSFVLAAPVAVQKVREACADAMDDGDDVVIESWKRGGEEGSPSSAHAQQEPSSSDSTPSQHQGQGSSPAPDDASGTHTDPSFSSSESKPPLLSTLGEGEMSWNEAFFPIWVKPASAPPPQTTDLDKTTALKESSSSPPEQMTDLDKTAALKGSSSSPPKPQSMNILSELVEDAKSLKG